MEPNWAGKAPIKGAAKVSNENADVVSTTPGTPKTHTLSNGNTVPANRK